MSNCPAKAKILYVDDDPGLRGMLSLVLEHQGLQVQTASNGGEGVELALEWLPDLILMDLMMPFMDGFQAAEALRADPRTRQTPIMAFSADSEASVPARTRAAGMNGLIPKSTLLADLVRIICAYLPSS
jgi:CheY-like chemotaxis protein